MSTLFSMLLSSLLAASVSGSESTCRPWVAASVSVAPSLKGHVLAIRDLKDSLRVNEWDSAKNVWSGWLSLPSPIGGVSDPWVQAPVGGINNIFALRLSEAGRWIEQWLRYPEGAIVRSNGIGQADSVVTRPVCGRIGSDGKQTLFAVFQDSMVRMRTWDSLARGWGGWSQMGMKSRLPLSLNQVTATQLNLFATNGSSLQQDWWKGTVWSGWVEPAASGIGSDPVSVNVNETEHFLFALSLEGSVQAKFWNGSFWSDWSLLNFPAKRSLTAVALGNDSVLLYGIDAQGTIIRTAWSRKLGWGAPEAVRECKIPDPPVASPPTAVKTGTRRLVAANAIEGILLVIQGRNDSLYSRIVHGSAGICPSWRPVPSQPSIVSNPWLQAPVGGLNNLYALGESNGVRRTLQWIYREGAFMSTNGLDESEDAVSLASGRIGSNGNQALFAVFKDSSVRMRVWDSLAWSWGGWIALDHKTTRTLDVVQVTDDQLNLYATMPDGRIDQRWWKSTEWSPWVVPSVEPITSGPSSANFDEIDHVLFGIDQDGWLVERSWNGSVWSAWDRLPWKPQGEPAPVVRDGILHLFFVEANGSIVELERTRGTAWRVTSRLPGQTIDNPIKLPESMEPTQTAFVRRGVLNIPESFQPVRGAAIVIHADGHRERLVLTSDGKQAHLRIRGMAVIQSGSKRLRVIGLD
ncbi:MAG: hypothetical protein IPK50_04810 [Fibrobacterota bacterium]|nr:hypothetical protein [Fibrobacterota bacterium]QQS06215.1 MAG: hypothetical protein IPK50_04810 [Fibrobacterota bacterium]